MAPKPFPSGRATHGLIGRPVKEDMAVGYARLCGQYAVASALLTGGPGIADFAPAAMADPERLRLAGLVNIATDANPATPMTRAAHLAKFRRNARAAARPLSNETIAALIALVDDLEHQPSTAPLLARVHGERP